MNESDLPTTKECLVNNVTFVAEIDINIMEIYFPIITVIKNTIIKCNSIYENAQCNKAICSILLDRAMSVELLIRILERRMKRMKKDSKMKLTIIILLNLKIF
ncbi:hypothetical protein F8M41_003090 [Gigaspora margarita]|uniref:Uncharacterized protein n=1 Tax=Gigaspora margarita TaxID=4874 RepID=A0A8H3XER9_GIGMA|nr:hypothetical protein F8M41_003090 [Gigaspora margarita]